MDDTPIIRFEAVTRKYGGARDIAALDDVSFEIARGESVAVMGPSGSGKSTLLNLMCGLDSPSSGSIFLDNTNLSETDDDERTRIRRRKVGMIFQTFNLLPTLSALENVGLTLRLQGIGKKESDLRAQEMLAGVGLEDRKDHLPDEMSGGERQRVAIARALVFDPPLLLADEPTGNLDSKSGESILIRLKELHKKLNTTVVLVTHDDFAAGFCERKITLQDGKIAGDSG
ncbi:MAG: ABC transporter ATP-binding protein [Pyrinomonadaceae bacterium]